MIRIENKHFSKVFAAIILLIAGCQSGNDSDNKTYQTWSAYKADVHSSSYSSLDQINLSNVGKLENVWTFQMNDLADGDEPVSSQSNPIIIDGIMYANSGKQTVYAVDALTGEEIWSFKTLEEGQPSAASRGVSYWESGDDKRILYTAGNYLLAIDAKTGKIIPSFGTVGRVSLNEGVRDDPEEISVTNTTPGRIFKDLIILGSRLPDFYGAPPGYIRAYNCKTGKLEWTFHTIPLPGEPGYETWPPNAYQYAGGVNCWAGMSIDMERSMVFLALGSPSYDYYGADRTGENLYGNCVLALDAATGDYKWHYQTVHHDLWDYDLPAPPNLVTLYKDGKDIDAVAQVTKQGFVFVLDRDTGEPVYTVEEQEVPASDLPGEETWPTQPFPSKPKAFVKQFMTEDDLNHYSEEDYKAILEQFRSVRYEGLFTPPDLKGTLSLPATRGGANWGGAAFDPNTTYLYIRGNNLPENNNFTGKASLTMLIEADSLNQNSVGSVTFEPGARTNWHSHPSGQIILVVDGEGYYQEKGSPKQIFRKGDAVKCPPDTPHWHGASADETFIQIAITGREGGPTQWMEQVTDEVYLE